MKKIFTFAVLVLIAVMGITGVYLTQHAGEVQATNKGDLNFYNRYFTTSKTPISDLNELIGSGTAGASGQVKVHDGTDYEPKTISATGDVTGTLGTTGAIPLVITANTVSSTDILNGTVALIDMASDSVNASKIVDNTVSSADILNGTIAATDIASNAVTASKILTNTVTLVIAAGTASNTVAVEASSILIDTQPAAGFSNNATITETKFSAGTWIVRTDASATDRIVNGVFFRP